MKSLIALNLRMILFLWVAPGLVFGVIVFFAQMYETCPSGYKQNGESCFNPDIYLEFSKARDEFRLCAGEMGYSDKRDARYILNEMKIQAKCGEDPSYSLKSTEISKPPSSLYYEKEEVFMFILALIVISYPLWILFQVFRWAFKTK